MWQFIERHASVGGVLFAREAGSWQLMLGGLQDPIGHDCLVKFKASRVREILLILLPKRKKSNHFDALSNSPWKNRLATGFRKWRGNGSLLWRAIVEEDGSCF